MFFHCLLFPSCASGLRIRDRGQVRFRRVDVGPPLPLPLLRAVSRGTLTNGTTTPCWPLKPQSGPCSIWSLQKAKLHSRLRWSKPQSRPLCFRNHSTLTSLMPIRILSKLANDLPLQFSTCEPHKVQISKNTVSSLEVRPRIVSRVDTLTPASPPFRYSAASCCIAYSVPLHEYLAHKKLRPPLGSP